MSIQKRIPPALADDIREKLPQPILPERPLWMAAYNAAWAIAVEKGLRPAVPWNEAAGPYVGSCRGDALSQWDACCMAHWLKYAQGAIAGLAHPLSCLDSFYAAQQRDGAIPREILPNGEGAPNKSREQDSPATAAGWRHSAFTNPPLFSWAEWEYYEHTGDDSRLRRVLPILASYFDWYAKGRSRKQGYFWWDGFGSGMDDLPRGDAHGWVDYTAQAALDCEFLANIALQVGNQEIAQSSSTNYLLLKELVNERMWNEMKLCYGDVDEDDLWTGPLHVGAYWALMANLATPERVAEMTKHLRSYRSFARPHMVPALAGFEHGFDRAGGGWRGGVWPPTTYMVVRALERCGEAGLSHHIALNHVAQCAEVFEQTGTFWDHYAPDFLAPAADARPDCCGWSALGPIAMLLESVIGVRVNATLGEIDWTLRLEESHGVRNLFVGGIIVDLHAAWADRKWTITVTASGPIEVRLRTYNGTVVTGPGKTVVVA